MSKGKFVLLLEYYFVLIFGRILSLLSVSCFYKLAFVFSYCCYYIFPSLLRRGLFSRLSLAFGATRGLNDLKVLERRIFEYAFYTFFEFLIFPRMTSVSFASRVMFSEGSSGIISDLMSRGKGLVLVSGHYGNWEFLGRAVSGFGYSVNVVYRALDNVYLDRYFNGEARSYSSCLIPREEVYYRGLEVLARNEILIFLADQHQARNGIEVSFFGRTVLSAKGPGLLSYRVGSPMMFAWIERRDNLFTHLVSFEEIVCGMGLCFEDYLYRSTQEFMLLLEGIIRVRPEEWWWFHSRWRD